MTSNLPDPPVPPECDLRGYEWMPFYGNHLFGSDFNSHASDSEWRAAVTLWWAAWNQQPAASLPSDDVALCKLADLGRDIKTWKKIKDRALHGFFLCNDGRLYHKFLAPIALESWKKRAHDRKRKASWRRKRDGDETGTGRGQDGDRTVSGTGTGRGQDRLGDGDVPAERRGEEMTGQEIREEKNKITPPASGGIGISLPHTGPLANTEDPAATAAQIMKAGNKKIRGSDQDAVRKALADGDLLALVRAYGGNDSRGHEWARDAAGRKLGRIAIVLDWAQQRHRPVREPSGLRSALDDWDRLLSAEQVEISRDWAEGLGLRGQKADSVPQEARSPQDHAQDRGEDDRAAESRETALEEIHG
jgi:hypothetical protein